ncbi:MAG: prolyl oligopeptidase family serine peptidase [Candidatus Obscuribacterales bacterium]|nr:prolyl oligopeptidase family serine peptidase [Candidatus Obscuribacterales bacterium]
MNIALCCSLLLSILAAQAGFSFKYPSTRTESVEDTYHGVKVKDPYRWLENNESAETKNWIETENKLTFSYLESLPSKQEFKNRLSELWNYDKYGVPTKRGENYFFTKLSGLQNQAVLYVSTSPYGKDARVLLDPNKLSLDGTVALSAYSISDDGKRICYGISNAGSDWTEWKVRDVASAADLSDDLKWIKFSSCEFTKDGKGIYYSRYPEAKNELKEANYYNKVYFHKIGSPQSEDQLILENKDEKEWEFSAELSEDGKYLIVSISRNTNPENLVYYKDLTKASSPIVHLIENWGAQYSFIDNDGPVFYFQTNKDAPRGRIIAIDTRKPEAKDWKETVSEKTEILRSVNAVSDRLVCLYLNDAHAVLHTYTRDGKEAGDIALPGIGSVNAISGRHSDKELFYSFVSFTEPPSVYSCDPASGKSSLIASPKVAFNPADYETKQVFYASKDGTKIPMFIVSKKGLELKTKPLPTFLYAYGGFNIPMMPRFSPSIVSWLEKGGIYAQPSLRGGGEYGEDWHKAGMKEKKQNVFDDFIAAAQWLIDNNYTVKDMLAVNGGSNGGLLIGAVMTQRPDLFSVAIPEVGVLDMLRYHKFTIGHAWMGEYGSSDDANELKYLLDYSPLHNVRSGKKYPATLVITGDHDDRVFPGHSFKFAASLQAVQPGDASPVLIRVETRTGHGAGKPTAKIIEEAADKYAFAWEGTQPKH